MDNISIERIWQDPFCFEIRVEAKSALAYATTDVYVTDPDIVELATALSSFPSEPDAELSWEKNWEIKSIETGVIPKKFSLKVLQKDRGGHLLIEVYMDIDDGYCDKQHHCCFFVETQTSHIPT